jgi:serine phosphatase RsbU (regulator of sigma subunit)/CHASE3 domain sensor protein
VSAADRSVAGRRPDVPLALTLGFLLVVVALLVAGGLYVRTIVGSAFTDAERIRTARVHVGDMLRQQLDEETGVRGYATLRNPIMLEPYYGGRANLPLYFRRVRADLVALKVDEALPLLRDAARMNYRWVHEVAFALIRSPARHRTLVLRGKTLVDRFRRDANAIDAALARRTVLVNARAQAAIVWVGAFSAAAVGAVILAAVIFTVQQYRLNVRLERERVASEQERRKAAEARAAYQAEKRIADVLQQAFAERLFPQLPTVAFSATYIPATEQTKIGGDWYDAIQLSEDRVLVAIGDITGHGIEAVVAMNKARQLLISSALLDATPGHVLQRVNAELVRGRSPISTAVSGVVDTRTGEFAYAAAGHPPPVLFEPGAGARLLNFGSLPLGVTANVEYATQRVRARPGGMIVLYTDGAIEYSRDLAHGEAALLRAVESVANGGVAEAAAAIREAIFRRQKVADDVAILTLRFNGEQASGYQRKKEG